MSEGGKFYPVSDLGLLKCFITWIQCHLLWAFIMYESFVACNARRHQAFLTPAGGLHTTKQHKEPNTKPIHGRLTRQTVCDTVLCQTIVSVPVELGSAEMYFAQKGQVHSEEVVV